MSASYSQDWFHKQLLLRQSLNEHAALSFTDWATTILQNSLLYIVVKKVLKIPDLFVFYCWSFNLEGVGHNKTFKASGSIFKKKLLGNI